MASHWCRYLGYQQTSDAGANLVTSTCLHFSTHPNQIISLHLLLLSLLFSSTSPTSNSAQSSCSHTPNLATLHSVEASLHQSPHLPSLNIKMKSFVAAAAIFAGLSAAQSIGDLNNLPACGVCFSSYLLSS